MPRINLFEFTYLPWYPDVSRRIQTDYLQFADCRDGVISLLRGYSPAELRELSAECGVEGYIWEAGIASTGTPVFEFTYLVGYPEGKE